MSLALEKALNKIERGAEEHLEVMRAEKKKIEMECTSTGTVPKLIGHIEKVEEEEQPEKEMKKDDTTTTEEEGPPVGPQRQKTQLVAALK